MATRQYIGNRYVPLFFKNPDGTANWLEGVSYEAFTVVTYANSSFTSRIPVPASVGAPNENPTYWAETGNYNEQVEMYRQEVQSLTNSFNSYKTSNDNRVSKIENSTVFKKKYVFIADSYGELDNNWIDQLVGYLGSPTFEKYAEGGSGFSKKGNNGHNFADIVNGLSVDEAVSDVVVCGGINDNSESVANIQNGVTALAVACASKFPNATFWKGCNGLIKNSAQQTLYNINVIQTVKNTRGGVYLTGVEDCNHNYSLLQDDRHPLGAASANIARGIFNAMKGGAAGFYFNEVGFPTNPYAEGQLSGKYSITVNNNILNVTLTPNGISSDLDCTFGRLITVKKEWIGIATLGSNSFALQNDYENVFPCRINVNWQSGAKDYDTICTIDGANLSVYVPESQGYADKITLKGAVSCIIDLRNC